MAKSFAVDTAASAAILTTAEAKTHLKVDTSADDTYIDNLISAATESAQIFTNRYFINTTLNQFGDTWNDLATLFKSKVSSVVHIKYYDNDNTQQTLATSVYQKDLEHQPARIGLKPNQSFPSLADRISAVECQYIVGYGSAASDVPEGIRQAVLLTVGNWYENRQNVVVGHSVNELPKSAQYLLEQFKVQTVC
tara:strand:- start:1940 stop:2521 length:582 start_codon:yes stop_codon:yes gene_type:complete